MKARIEIDLKDGQTTGPELAEVLRRLGDKLARRYKLESPIDLLDDKGERVGSFEITPK